MKKEDDEKQPADTNKESSGYMTKDEYIALLEEKLSIVDSGHKYLLLRATKGIRINLVRGTQSVFGASMYDWPTVPGGTTRIYIDTDSYIIQKGVPYQMQLTSSSAARYDVSISYQSSNGTTMSQ